MSREDPRKSRSFKRLNIGKFAGLPGGRSQCRRLKKPVLTLERPVPNTSSSA
jgi:hypothetical protein